MGSSSGFSLRWAARRSAASAQGGLWLWPRAARGIGPGEGLAALARVLACDRLGLRRLLQDHVGVGAADAEGGDAGAARAAVRLPGRLPRSAARSPPPPSRPWRRARRRAGSSAARPARIAIDHLDHAGDPGGGLGVADVGLDRAEPQRLAPGPGRRWRAGRRPRSGRRGWCRCRGPRPRRRRRARGRALARAWRITRSWEGPLGAVRPLEAPSWLTAEPRISGEDRVAVALGVGEALEDEHADALRPAGAVGGLGEGLAAPVGGEAALAAELDEERRGWRARSPRRPGPACTRPRAAPGRPGASRPARRSRRCRRVIAGPSRPRA